MGFRTASPDRYYLLRAYARENRQNATLAEQVLWRELRKKEFGVRFLRQHIIGDYIVDFVALEVSLVIEVDGGYHAEQQQIEDDERRTRELNSMGFEVIRFSNEEVMYDTDNVIELIEQKIEDNIKQ